MKFNKTTFLFLFLALLMVAYWYIMQDFDKTEQTIYTNARITTIDENMPSAQAMLVENGIIQAIGSNEEMNTLKGNNTTIVDLKQAHVLPGFIDPHSHPAVSALLASMVDLSGFRHSNNTEVWTYLAETVQKTKPNEWIICKGIDPILVQNLKAPTLRFLDSIAPQNPVILFAQSLHSYWGNTSAFEKVGISNKTPDPSKLSYYEKDSLGKLTGLIVEQEALRPIMEALQKDIYNAKALTQSIVKVMKTYALAGNTTVVSAGLTINDKKSLVLFDHLSAGSPKFLNQVLHQIGMLPKRTPMPRHFIYLRHDAAHLLPEQKTSDDDFYDILGIKHWYDGSPYIGSMYLKKPYLPSPLAQVLRIPKGHQGKALVKTRAFEEFLQENHNKGWQIAIHAQGDAAITETLAAFEKINQQTDLTKLRHRMEHCLLMSDANLDKMKTLNMTPSFHINHIYYYGDALKNSLIGEDRATKILPVRSAEARHLKYSLHADQPMFDSQPFRLIQTAIERKTKAGEVLGEQQKITILSALKALTIHAAWQIHKEDKLGSLTKGKYADFIIVDKNPLTTPIEQLETIQVLKTYVNGNLVN